MNTKNEIIELTKKISELENTITLLKQQFAHSHDLMNYIIEHSRSAIAVHDRDLKYVYVSERYLSEYKVKEKNIIGKHHYEIFPDLPQKWRDVHQRALKGEIIRAEDDPYVRKDGTVEWTRWECRPWYESNGNIGGIVIYTEVITDEKKAELELIDAKIKAEQSEERYRMFIEQISDGIYRMDLKPPVSTDLPLEEMIDAIYKNSAIVECNAAMGKMYAIDSRQLIGRKLIDFHEGNGLAENREEMRKFVKNGFRIENSVTVEYDAKGDIHYFSNSTVGIVSNGFLTRLWGTQKDITEKQKYENDLLHAKEKAEESDRLKTAFLQNMSHEIRTPLNTIVGFSQLISNSKMADENLRYYSEMIASGSDKLLSIITDVMEISQIRTNQVSTSLRTTDVISVIKRVADSFREIASAKQIDFILDINIPDSFEMVTDERKIEKICRHLADNAVKFTHKGAVRITVSSEKNDLLLKIEDTGIGIPGELQEVVFEPFRQIETELSRTYGGNGLGLAIVSSYVGLLNGSLIMESEPEKGTSITVRIPSAIPVTTVRVVPEIRNDHTDKTCSILIVEDEYSSYMYLRELLKADKVRVLRALNGQEAIDICRKNNNNISLILMDIKMPVMDGNTSAKIIKSFLPGVPIIAQTAFALESERDDYLQSFDDLLTKPIRREEFRKLVSKYVDL